MNTAHRLAVVLVLLVASAAVAADGGFTYRPVSVAFVPRFSTNGAEWRSVSSNLSLNIIGGSIGQVRGVELGGVFNIDGSRFAGAQMAGVINVVGEKLVCKDGPVFRLDQVPASVL